MNIDRFTSYQEIQKEWEREEKYDAAHPVQAFFKSLYRTVRAFIYNIPDLPRGNYRKVKRGVQRAYRGWADEDTWALDHYLSKVIKQSLTHLKEHKNGYPATEFTGDDAYDYDKARWDAILDEMIYAFDLNEQIANGYRQQYLPTLSPKARKDMEGLTLKEEIRRRKGMLLFVKYYFSLWD